MFRKLQKPLAAGALAAALLLPQAVLAANTNNGSAALPVANAPAPAAAAATPATDTWISIQPGEDQWYTFKYDYDNTNRPAEIRMYTEPNESVSLMLLNSNQAQEWQQSGGTREHFGAATTVYNLVVDRSANHAVHTNDGVRNYDYDKEDAPKIYEKGSYASWSGVIGNSGTYSILVHRNARATGAANYRFTVNGDGLSLLQPLN